MPAPTASPSVSSTVGLKNMVIAPLTEDTEEGTTYGTLQAVAGAIEATITPASADPDVQYADDHEFDTLYPDPEVTFSTSMADIPLAIQEMIFGNAIDDNGVLVRTSTDKPPYFAVGFMSEKANHKFRYHFMDAPDRPTALRRLDFWLDACDRLELPEFKSCRKTLVNWKPYILNAFDFRLSNGFTEGCNNAIKTLKRVAFGFRNFRSFRTRILLSLDPYPNI